MDMMINRLKALSDTNRFRILMMLTERDLCVCEILEVLDIAGGTLSNHLKILKNADLIDQNKEGRWILYALKDEATREFLRSLEKDIIDRTILEHDRKFITGIDRLSCSKSAKMNQV
ncbi:MAG: helix-turn-helix transcriptional regulator [Spirochaetales bacterium]|nr:helix-turn-helix transcriptional regulator [Spirochaetales bacterium]